MGPWMSTSKSNKKPKHQPSQQDRAMLDLKAARDKLKVYQTRMESEAGQLQQKAMGFLKNGNKEKALLFVKMKKLREKKIGDINSQLLTLEEMVQTIEWETQSLQVFDALKEGNKALQDIHSIMSIEAVEQLMDDTAEAIAYQKEIDELIAGESIDLDDASLEAELNQLTLDDPVDAPSAAGAVAASMPAVPETPVMPVAPTHTPNPVASAQGEEEAAQEPIAA